MCLDMARGVLLHFPESGGAIDQDDELIGHIWAAWRTWHIMNKRSDQHTKEDIEFIRKWVPDAGQNATRKA